MESLSEASDSGGSPWKGLLLTVSFLSCWIQPTSAQSDSVRVVPNPPYGIVGSSFLLDIQGTQEQSTKYTWYRSTAGPFNQIAFYDVTSGQQTPSDSRLKVFSNGSLLIHGLTLSDTGDYIVQFISCTSSRIVTAQGHLAVYETASKPDVITNSTNIMENSTLILECIREHEGMKILWFFNTMLLSLNEKKLLSENNRTLTIKNVMRENAGSYQCEIWNPISANRSDPITLIVNYGPNNIMIFPHPEREEIEVKFQDPLILVCKVDSYPLTQYEWQVNGTVNSNFSGNTYIIKNVSWEDSGNYTCLAWNAITELSVSKDVKIRVVAEESPGGGNGSSLSGGAIAGIVIGVLVGMILIGTLIYFLFFRKTGGASKENLSKNSSVPKRGEDTTLYENTILPKGSALSAQTSDMSRVDVYERIGPWKNPQTLDRGEIPKDVVTVLH